MVYSIQPCPTAVVFKEHNRVWQNLKSTIHCNKKMQ